MKQKKTMKLWQMLALAGICLGLIINMFLPLWNISGTKLADWMIDVVAEEAEKQSGISGLNEFSRANIDKFWKYASDGNTDEVEQGIEMIDDAFEDAEKKLGFNLASMSGFDILTFDVNVLFLENPDYTKEDLEKFERKLGENDLKKVEEVREKITYSKVMFGIEYCRTAILLLLILLGFFLKWNKLINSIICTVIGCFTAINYGWVWRGLPSFVFDKIAENEDLLQNGGKEVVEQSLPYVQSLWGAIVGLGIIVGFILGVLLFVMGLVSCFVGKPQESVDPFPIPNPDPFPFPDPFPNPNPFPTPDPIPDPAPTPTPSPILTPPKAGRVKCTQGVAMGQGYKLPADRKVIVGKSPQNATLVIHDPHVSNIHCSIRYRAETNSYIIKDHSTNGTFVNGIRLGKEVAVEYPAGTVISLADGANKITLG